VSRLVSRAGLPVVDGDQQTASPFGQRLQAGVADSGTEQHLLVEEPVLEGAYGAARCSSSTARTVYTLLPLVEGSRMRRH
jgi:hypothetical protein